MNTDSTYASLLKIKKKRKVLPTPYINTVYIIQECYLSTGKSNKLTFLASP